jgi:hypothetical protein
MPRTNREAAGYFERRAARAADVLEDDAAGLTRSKPVAALTATFLIGIIVGRFIF